LKELKQLYSMGRNKKNTYRKVFSLPENAYTVSAYAKEMNYSSTPYIYQLWRERCRKEISFEIVDFRGINFIIPSNNYKLA
jgi:hypothetical protein